MRRGALAACVVAACTVASAHAQTYLVLVSGLAGEPVYRERFHAWASELRSAAMRLGVPDSHVIYLAEDPARDPSIRGPATKDQLAETLRRIAARAAPDATVFVVLFGHGSDRDEPRLSLPGPDLSAPELDSMLDALPAQRVVVINTASASGGFVPVLSGPRRVVVTATKSGFEQNHAVFGKYFTEAFGTAAADLDKDGRVSVLEAFLHAKAAVERSYATDRRLLTEHALLDDNGDGQGTGEPSATAADGSLASAVYLGSGAASGATPHIAADSTTLALERQRRDLEERVAALRARKESMPQATYERELEDLVARLAEVSRALRDRAVPRLN
ncbi:MAG TPA: C13 family peptidase [Gemmatimonadales bacterium]|nr:C13 family peptidase [Gemmatimonadales bacterium]